MHCTYICCLGEGSLKHILGTYNLAKLEKLGYDVSSLCILEFSPKVRLRIYSELKKAQPDILQSMCPKAQVIVHPNAMMEMFPGSLDTGVGLVVNFDNPSVGLASGFLKAFEGGISSVVSSEHYQDLLVEELSSTTVRALFRRIDARMINREGVYTLEWGVSKHPLIN